MLPPSQLLAHHRRARFAIGLDPGQQTGYSVFDRTTKRLIECLTLDFSRVLRKIRAEYHTEETIIFIEYVANRPTFRRKPGEAIGVTDRKARNVGAVTREAKLLIGELESSGFVVVAEGYTGKEWDDAYFKRVTGWTGRTSQHARDAASLCFGR